jgi:hypothetical protein
MAAPALAASMALSAICLGLRGTCGLRSCVLPEPVTAQVMKTSRFMQAACILPGSIFLENRVPFKGSYPKEIIHLPFQTGSRPSAKARAPSS